MADDIRFVSETDGMATVQVTVAATKPKKGNISHGQGDTRSTETEAYRRWLREARQANRMDAACGKAIRGSQQHPFLLSPRNLIFLPFGAGQAAAESGPDRSSSEDDVCPASTLYLLPCKTFQAHRDSKYHFCLQLIVMDAALGNFYPIFHNPVYQAVHVINFPASAIKGRKSSSIARKRSFGVRAIQRSISA